VSRRSLVRFPASSELADEPEPVPVVGPVVFTLRFRGIERSVDLSDLPCPRLVRPMAAALASIGGDDGVLRTWNPDFQQMVRHLRAFVVFAASRASDRVAQLALADLTPRTLHDFEADLLARFGSDGKQVESFMRTVVRLLRLAGRADPRLLTAPMQGRLGYTTSGPSRSGKPLDAYPMPVLATIEQAAVADVRAIRDRIDAGRALAATGADPQTEGWSQRRNVLWHILAEGPLETARWRHRRALRCMPGGIRGLNADVLLTAGDLVPLLVALICMSGLEPECAKTLRAGCLSSPSRGFVTLSYDKKRAHTSTAKTMRVRDGGGLTTPGGLVRLAVRLTEHARPASGSDALWVGASDAGLVAFFDRDYEMTDHLRVWANRHRLHELTDHGGASVRLDLRRLRKTVKSRHYLRTGGLLDDFATGHTKQVAASRYADIDAHRELHDHAVETGLRQALEVALPPPVVATCNGTTLPRRGAGAGPLTSAQAHAAASVEQDVFLASCTGFYDSPFARGNGSPCPVAVWGCLECPNAVFTQRHLPSLVGFAGFLEDQREDLSTLEWQARYGLAHERLTGGILPAFTTAQLDQARRDAVGQPLPPARLLEHLT
jgi:hypothetical protein